MFKAICIAHNSRKHPDFIQIPIGDEVTIDARKVNPKDGILHYHVAEYPLCVDGAMAWYIAKNFAPLDGPDETERLEAYQREHLAAEGKLFERLAQHLVDEPMPQDAFDRVWKNIERTL